LIVTDVSEKSAREFVQGINHTTYQMISKDCFNHTLNSHSLNVYERFIKNLVDKSEAA